MMLTPVWTLISWPKVWFSVDHERTVFSQIHHLSTSVNPQVTDEGCICGQVLYGLQTPKEMIGIAWDWVAVSGRILAISDPMAIVSNAFFVGRDGKALAEPARLVQLNNVINGLPWQRPVRRHLPCRTSAATSSVEARSQHDARRAAQRAMAC